MRRKSDLQRWILGLAMLALAVLLLVADQLTKRRVLRTLSGGQPYTLIPGLLELRYTENTGAAFGLFQNAIWLVYAVSAAAYAVILWALFRYRRHSFFSYAACAMLLAGGVGNLIDRWRFGFVVDFIHVSFFDYVFNFADCCVTVGCVFLILHTLLLSRWEKREKGADGGEAHG